MNKISIDINKSVGIVSKELHGQFIEFLGTGIYDGIWVGEESDIPNYNGLRKEVVDALKKIEPPIIRWPGGCYADTYHWRDGVGPRENRKITYNENFGTEEIENNHFGTHEFIELCKLVGAEPWININLLSGSVKEMVDWIEYCNRPSGTSLSNERITNGSEEPFNVEYWGIGNEAWAGGGNYTAQSYANDYRKYATAFPKFGSGIPWAEETISTKLIAVGPDGNKPKERVKWTKDFFKAIRDYRQPKINSYDLHFYNWNISHPEDKVTDFDKDSWYRVIDGAFELEEVIKEQYELIQEELAKIEPLEGPFPSETHCDLIVGEWGNWHNMNPDVPSVLWQQCTMRDAITTALTLDIFHRNSDKVKIACVAQSVNVLNSLFLTDGAATILTPNYYVFEMYKVHRDSESIAYSLDSETVSGETFSNLNKIYSFVSKREDIISISIVNIEMDHSESIEIQFESNLEYLEGVSLYSKQPTDYNSAENPNQVAPSKPDSPNYSTEKNSWTLEVPKASVSVFQFKVQEV